LNVTPDTTERQLIEAIRNKLNQNSLDLNSGDVDFVVFRWAKIRDIDAGLVSANALKRKPGEALVEVRPSDNPIGEGLLMIDFGARQGGYNADETRMFAVGRAATEAEQKAYHVVRSAQLFAKLAIEQNNATLAQGA
jgi:hypothetical protein